MSDEPVLRNMPDLEAEFDHQPAGYAFFFDSYSTFQGRGLFLEDLFVRPQFRKNKIGSALFITRRSYCPRRKLFWSYATCPRLERNCDPVLQQDECHFPRRLENRVLGNALRLVAESEDH
jgi:GNAT superfamily N-acetyltransferase